MNFTERLKLVIENFASSKKEFAIKIGVPQTTFNTYILKGKSIPSDIIESILTTFPSVSAEWLFRGHGKMLKDEGDATAQVNIDLRKNHAGDMSALGDGSSVTIDGAVALKSKIISAVEKIASNPNASPDAIDAAVRMMESVM